jgi:signal transduction histidine kinase
MPLGDAQAMEELRREAAELRASRTRVVTAADDQRRAIERELHDGAMQHLVALGVNLQLAGGLVPADSPELTELLGEMLQNVHEALDEMRQLAWRIYPSLLLDRGLGDALRTAAAGAGIPVRVETAAFGRCARAVEASIYFCCVELLRHASEDGHEAAVRLWSEDELMCFDVTLEHADIELWRRRDLSTVSDRLGAFGGRLVVEPERGVRISGAIRPATEAQGVIPEPWPTSAR